MACSPKPLQDLSKHFNINYNLPLNQNQSNLNSDNNNRNNNFKSNSIHSIRQNELNRLISGEFESFSCNNNQQYRQQLQQPYQQSISNSINFNLRNNNYSNSAALTQMEAMPPEILSTSNSTFPSSSSSSKLNLLNPSIETEDSDSDELSSYWNPETETQSYITSHSSKPTYSTATYSPQSRPTTNPSFDEAIEISSTPPPALSTSNSNSTLSNTHKLDSLRIDNSNTNSTPTPPHPLTFETPTYSAWDFDKLFSSRRKWFNGVRIPNEEFESILLEGDSTDDVRGRQIVSNSNGGISKSRNESKSGLRNELSISESAGSVSGVGGEEERQKEIFDSMRRVAMSRLKALASHFSSSI